ncbi:MAG: hypothetical protein IT287_07705 [Bdellovibrionaceae bacterium]|nr:hypothetical protein [Pseudobdellovibrionaceae bacterium]
MKKFFITCILLGSFVPLFQNCGKQDLNGNGDPYEGSDLANHIGDDYESELSDPFTQSGELTTVCSGIGSIKRVEFSLLGTGTEMIAFFTQDNKARSIKNSTNVNTLSNLNVVFTSGITIKSLNIYNLNITIGVENAGTLVYEQLTCTKYR